VSKHALRLLNHPEPANGDRCRRLLSPERGSLDAARRQTYARAHVVQRGASCWFCPDAAVPAMPARLLLLCLLLRSLWLTVEGDRPVGAAGVLHRRGGPAAVAVRVGVAGGVPEEQCQELLLEASRLLQVAQPAAEADPCEPLLLVRSFRWLAAFLPAQLGVLRFSAGGCLATRA
jgi:hypothetical protein